VYRTSFRGFPTIVGNDYHTSFWLGLNTTGHVRLYPRGIGLGGFVESPGAISLNEWTHIAATYNSAVGYRIYINGVLDALGAGILGSVGTSAGELRIGADYESGLPDFFFRGYLDEIRIWNDDRSLPDIRATMYAGVGRPASVASGAYDGLVANWSCEGPFVTGINDYAFPNNLANFYASAGRGQGGHTEHSRGSHRLRQAPGGRLAPTSRARGTAIRGDWPAQLAGGPRRPGLIGAGRRV